MEHFGRSRDDLLFLVADTTIVNPTTAIFLGCKFIGCASHRFNLAVREHLIAYEDLLCDINTLMMKLSNIKIAKALGKVTELEPFIRNETQWSLAFSMLKRFLKLKDVLVSWNHPEVNKFIPDEEKLRSLKSLENDFKVFESVSKALQSPAINLAEVQLLFEAISEKYPALQETLQLDASLGFCKNFEVGIAKIIDGKEENLTAEEKKVVAMFLKGSEVQTSDTEEKGIEKDFATTLLECSEKSKEGVVSNYLNLN